MHSSWPSGKVGTGIQLLDANRGDGQVPGWHRGKGIDDLADEGYALVCVVHGNRRAGALNRPDCDECVIYSK